MIDRLPDSGITDKPKSTKLGIINERGFTCYVPITMSWENHLGQIESETQIILGSTVIPYE